MNKDGKIFFEQQELTLNELEAKLKRVISSIEDSMVIVKADKEVVLGKAVSVMDLAKRLGAKRLGIQG